MISFVRGFSNRFLLFLDLVDLVLKLNLFSVERKDLVGSYLLFTLNLHFELLNASTYCKTSDRPLSIYRNQLLLTTFFMSVLLPVVVVEKLLDRMSSGFLRMQ